MDFNSYPDHRVNFFDFLKSVINNSFTALFNIPAEQFKTVIDCVVWAFKHDLPAICELGLETLIITLRNVNMNLEIANQFYQLYYMQLLQDIIFILTDSLHKSGFKQQSTILAMMFEVVDKLTVPVNQQVTGSNKEFVYQFIVDLLSSSFTTVPKQTTAAYVGQLFQTSSNLQQFKIVLRDYLINLSQFSNDPDALDVTTPDQQQQPNQQLNIEQQPQQIQQIQLNNGQINPI